MNILITGANGFLGSHLVKHFIELNYNVFAVVRKLSNLKKIDDVLSNQNLHLIYSDMLLSDQVFDYEVDIVIHTATSYGRADTSAYDVFLSNEMFAMRILDLAIKKDVKLFINTDSFFNKPEYISYSYLNYYKISKSNFARWCELIAKDGNIRFVNMILEQIYGPLDDESKFVGFMMKSLLANKSELDLSSGEQKRDFIFIDDVVDAYDLVVHNYMNFSDSFLRVGVGSGYSVSIKNFVTLLKDITMSVTKLNFGALPYRENEIMESSADIGHLIKMGWKPKIDIKQGIQCYLDSYRL